MEPWKVTKSARGCWGGGDKMGTLIDEDGNIVEEGRKRPNS